MDVYPCSVLHSNPDIYGEIFMHDIPTCPDCGAPLDWDEVDIGVGVQRGNYRCTECDWSDRVEEDPINDDDLPW